MKNESGVKLLGEVGKTIQNGNADCFISSARCMREQMKQTLHNI